MPPPTFRIAVFHDLPSGGAKRTVHGQVAELVRRGHRVECFVTSTAEESFLPLQEVADRVTVVSVPTPPDRERTLAGRPTLLDLARWLGVYRGILRATRAVARGVDAGDYDALLVHPSQFTQAPHVLRWASTPTIYYCHEVLRAAYEPLISPLHVRLAIRLTLGKVDRRNARAAGAIAVNSRYTGRRVRSVYGRPARVVAPAVDSDTFHPTAEPRGNYVLAVGALHPLKGFDFIVDALGRLPRAICPALIIVSDRARTQERRRIEDRAEAAGLDLELRERVSEADLARLYGRARAVLVAAHREPLGLVPLEAMAAGTAVVAVDDGGLAETVVHGETGYLVPRDVDSFSGAVRQLLEHPDEAAAMGGRGRARVEEYWSWERSVDELIQLIEETVASR